MAVQSVTNNLADAGAGAKGTQQTLSLLAELNQLRRDAEIDIVTTLGPDDIFEVSAKMPLAKMPLAGATALRLATQSIVDSRGQKTESPDGTVTLNIKATGDDGKPLLPEDLAMNILVQAAALLARRTGVDVDTFKGDLLSAQHSIKAAVKQDDIKGIIAWFSQVNDRQINDGPFMWMAADNARRKYLDARTNDGITEEVLERRFGSLNAINEEVISAYRLQFYENKNEGLKRAASQVSERFSNLSDNLEMLDELTPDTSKRLKETLEIKISIAEKAKVLLDGDGYGERLSGLEQNTIGQIIDEMRKLGVTVNPPKDYGNHAELIVWFGNLLTPLQDPGVQAVKPKKPEKKETEPKKAKAGSTAKAS